MAWTRKLPSGRWHAEYRDATGRKRAVPGTFLRQGDAKHAGEEEEARIRRGEWTDPRLARIKFDEWAKHYMTLPSNQRATTRARDESYLRCQILPAFEGVELGAIQPIEVRLGSPTGIVPGAGNRGEGLPAVRSNDGRRRGVRVHLALAVSRREAAAR